MIRTVVILSLLAACAAPVRRFEDERVLMGTKARVVFYARDKSAAAAAFARIEALEAVMSDYRKDSELMRLCARAGEGPVSVSEDLFRVLAASIAISRRSGGAFDITIGPLTHAWRARRQPTAADRALVGWRNLELRDGTAALKRRGMLLDLGGIGKGFAADEALETLRRHDVTRALVDMGGDIAIGAPPPGEAGWRVGVAGRIRRLAHVAVATSGHSERPGHILDPRTGKSTSRQLRVTVLAPTCTQADAWASACMVTGPEAPHPPNLKVLFEGLPEGFPVKPPHGHKPLR